MDESGQSDEKALRVEGQGCVFGRQVAFGYLPETETQVQFRVSTKSGELQNMDHLKCYSLERWRNLPPRRRKYW
jgi:hypothetical protein